MSLTPASFRIIVVLLVFGAVQWWASDWLASRPKKYREEEAQVYLPPVLQLLGAGGDRYLAANVNTFRAMIMGIGELKPETYQLLAWIQRDAARFNPSHEDNYYIASATLPWHDHLPEAQEILKAAIHGRPNDKLPPFFYGFHQMHFLGDKAGAAETLREAAKRMPSENDKLVMEELASRWLGMGDLREAARIIRIMANQTRHKEFHDYLLKRADRMEVLLVLRNAADVWVEREKRRLPSLQSLVDEGLIGEIPQDPLGGYFVIDRKGQVVAIMQKPKLKSN